MANLYTEVRYLIEQLQVISGFGVDSSLRVFSRDLKKSLKVTRVFEMSPFKNNLFSQILEEIESQWSSDLVEHLPELETLIRMCCYLLQNLLLQRKTNWITKSTTVERIDSCLVKIFSEFRDKMKPFAMDIVITFINDTKLWHLEHVCARLFRILLSAGFSSEFIYAFTKQIENSLKYGFFQVATETALVLHQILILETYWKRINFTEVTPLLRMYHTIITTEAKNQQMEVCSSFELCLKSLFRVMSTSNLLDLLVIMIPLALDTTESVSVPFGNLTLEGVICYLKKGNFCDVPPFLLEYLIDSVASSEPSRSYFACKVLARFFDDKKNYYEFLFPKIFHSYMTYNINPSVPESEKELSLIVTYQKSIYQALLMSVKQHSGSKRNLNAIYTTICMIIIKVLPGSEAATIVCLLMDMQNFFIEAKVGQKVKNYGHGLVLSLMSLYCWIYRGKPLLTYVDTLISKRYAEAQHLLPPSSAVQGPDVSYVCLNKTRKQLERLRSIGSSFNALKLPFLLFSLQEMPLAHQNNFLFQTSFKTSAYQSNKKNLFFDNLELRYALWKCFVTKETVVEVSPSTLALSESGLARTGTQNDFQLKFISTTID